MAKIKINKKTYTVKKTIRSLFLFERVTERPFSVNSILDNYLLIYCSIMANNPDCSLTWDEFIDAVDKDDNLLKRLQDALEDPAEKMIAETEETGDGEKKG